MTTTVHESKSITLLNDQEIKIRPLKISLLRDFMKEFEKIDAVSEDNSKCSDCNEAVCSRAINRQGSIGRYFRSSYSI